MAYGKSSKAGAPPCGLYLTTPQDFNGADFVRALRQVFLAINASEYEKNRHILTFRVQEGHASQAETAAAAELCELARGQGLVFLCANDIHLAKTTGADGVMLDNPDDLETARTMLGDDAIIGVRCGSSRRRAEQALGKGADCVSFYDEAGGFLNPEIVRWWRLKTDNPCVVEGRLTNDDCGFYAAAGADFIDGSSYIWAHPEGVMKGVVNMAYAIDLALEQAS